MAPKYNTLPQAVEAFAITMLEKLKKKQQSRWRGWNDSGLAWPCDCRRRLREHLSRGDPIDVANFAMFLWNLSEPTSKAGETRQFKKAKV